MAQTKIEWCDEVWNPVWGCHNHCPYCYAQGIARRFGKTPEQKDFTPTWIENNFNRKFRRDTQRIFVNSMSDVAYWRPEWWDRVLNRISELPQYQFIFLTKGGFAEYEFISFPEWCILGVTEDDPNGIHNASADNMALLNVEPIQKPLTDPIAIGSIWLYDWIIIGAETGNRAGKPIPAFSWYGPIIDRAIENGIPYFIKPSLKDITPPDLYRQDFPLLAQT